MAGSRARCHWHSTRQAPRSSKPLSPLALIAWRRLPARGRTWTTAAAWPAAYAAAVLPLRFGRGVAWPAAVRALPLDHLAQARSEVDRPAWTVVIGRPARSGAAHAPQSPPTSREDDDRRLEGPAATPGDERGSRILGRIISRPIALYLPSVEQNRPREPASWVVVPLHGRKRSRRLPSKVLAKAPWVASGRASSTGAVQSRRAVVGTRRVESKDGVRRPGRRTSPRLPEGCPPCLASSSEYVRIS